MRTRTWWSLLARNHFSFSLARWELPLLTTLVTPLHSVCHRWQEFRWRRRIAAVGTLEAPLFVIGHWRSGTTLLHEFLVRDPRHGYPDTFDCFSPSDFLSTRGFVQTCFPFLMPERRPMDNVATGWDRPQEDEFAIMNLGIPSIYTTAAFPDHGPANVDYLDFAGLSKKQIDAWKQGLAWFLRRVQCRDPRRMVLKSPPHLGKVKTLVEEFPRAQFVHIVRHPAEVYASTKRLWQALFHTQGLQAYSGDWLDEFVLTNFERLYAAFREQRQVLEAGQLCEVRYEKLVADPMGEVQRIYEQLHLGGWEEVKPRLKAYVASLADYEPNRHFVDERMRHLIATRWEWYCREYGYTLGPPETPE